MQFRNGMVCYGDGERSLNSGTGVKQTNRFGGGVR
jgi:hypothetical protein